MVSMIRNRHKYCFKGYAVKNQLNNHTAKKILIVDENPFSRLNLVDILSFDGYQVIEADEHTDIADCVRQNNPDLILLELFLPQQNTLEICKQLKKAPNTSNIPIIFMTVSRDRDVRINCLEAGGDDLLIKPLDRLELITRVKLLIQQKILNDNLYETEEVLFRIAKAVENPSLDGSSSENKLFSLAQGFGEYLGLNNRQIKSLIYAAYLHDIGTVAVPEEILVKKGQLTPAEKEIVREHVLIGEKICQPLKNRVDILPIIRHHHEKWDGSGYPDGLVGSEIPWLAQIFQIMDIYDAITSERSYKKAMKPEEAIKIIQEEAKKGWRNPELVETFTAFISEQEKIVFDYTA